MIEGFYFGHPPADFRYRTFNIAVRGADPVADAKRSVEIEHNAREKIAQNIFTRHTHSDTADSAEGQQAR